MQKGYLRIELRLGNNYMPIPNANILVKEPNGNIIYNIFTDEMGSTAKVDLSAPDEVISYEPGADTTSFSTYDVEVPAFGGYATLTIKGVQIFPNKLAILPIHNFPIAPNSTPEESAMEIIIKPTSPLTETEPEDSGPAQQSSFSQKKNIFTTNIERKIRIMDHEGKTQFTPLPANDITVPNYITVHLGPPDSDALNVRVPFIDYIKNVASSEIFPTWPEAAIKANIYAQISFALNRIFTVWYRSRGYDFDITNSTAYDQSFVYGRNIFENISQYVDGMFNLFLRRLGRREPFFAQYCNGTTVTCDGLSQWGTVPLAEEGYTPFEILTYYYPEDIRIFESNNFLDLFGTYRGYPYVEGESGDDIRLIQDSLNRISANYPLIPIISEPNGFFGPETTEAVKVFQETFNLTPDGIVGKDTWYAIIRIFVGVARLGELTSEGIRIGIGSTPPTSILRLGSRGEDVIELQFILNFIAQFYPIIPLVINNGVFTENTEQAVIAFQKLFFIEPADGIVGPRTWNDLYYVYKVIEHIIANPIGAYGPPYPEESLRVGSVGHEVMLVQSCLREISAVYPSIPEITADGIYGPATEAAVRAFQIQFNLFADGIVGRITWNKIFEICSQINAEIPSYPGRSLRIDDRGEDVRYIQNLINLIAEFYPNIPPILPDGWFGPVTESIVRTFQTEFGLTPDGIIGPETWNKIVEVYQELPQ
ncbi:MAG: hypothetical protein E7234_13110 [Lachnospiraceae bacterium]|nr:hypothetical protein [Lachnospiraceae bacterium]